MKLHIKYNGQFPNRASIELKRLVGNILHIEAIEGDLPYKNKFIKILKNIGITSINKIRCDPDITDHILISSLDISNMILQFPLISDTSIKHALLLSNLYSIPNEEWRLNIETVTCIDYYKSSKLNLYLRIKSLFENASIRVMVNTNDLVEFNNTHYTSLRLTIVPIIKPKIEAVKTKIKDSYTYNLFTKNLFAPIAFNINLNYYS